MTRPSRPDPAVEKLPSNEDAASTCSSTITHIPLTSSHYRYNTMAESNPTASTTVRSVTCKRLIVLNGDVPTQRLLGLAGNVTLEDSEGTKTPMYKNGSLTYLAYNPMDSTGGRLMEVGGRHRSYATVGPDGSLAPFEFQQNTQGGWTGSVRPTQSDSHITTSYARGK